uniref:Secreted protein n=1 Tax=Steinernema glaseri TaxID=37863 RepID=A0A1I7ZNQ2_9BILA
MCRKLPYAAKLLWFRLVSSMKPLCTRRGALLYLSVVYICTVGALFNRHIARAMYGSFAIPPQFIISRALSTWFYRHVRSLSVVIVRANAASFDDRVISPPAPVSSPQSSDFDELVSVLAMNALSSKRLCSTSPSVARFLFLRRFHTYVYSRLTLLLVL